MRVINGFDDFKALVGCDIGVSEVMEITQEQINRFAESTHDHQWIHTDPEKAALDSPFKATIAHGYLTLSLVTYLWQTVVDVRNVKLIVNYGMENLRFNQPVVVNSRVFACFRMEEVTNLRGITRIRVRITMNVVGMAKPAFECIAIFLYHFE